MFDDNVLLCCDSAEFHVMTEILERQKQKTNKKTNTENKKENKMNKINIVTIVEYNIITGAKYGTVEVIVDEQPQSQTTDKETLLNKHKQQQVLKNNNIIRQRMQCK